MRLQRPTGLLEISVGILAESQRLSQVNASSSSFVTVATLAGISGHFEWHMWHMAQRRKKLEKMAKQRGRREALEAGAINPSCVISPSSVTLCAKKYANKIVNGAKRRLLGAPLQLVAGSPLSSAHNPGGSSLSQPDS